LRPDVYLPRQGFKFAVNPALYIKHLAKVLQQVLSGASFDCGLRKIRFALRSGQRELKQGSEVEGRLPVKYDFCKKSIENDYRELFSGSRFIFVSRRT
jgi:hypothetical protein